MPTALELYYQNKAEGRKASPVLARRVEKELAGSSDLLKKHSPGFFIKLLDLLDRPGNATRALLIGKLGGLKGLIPFAQVIEDLTGWDIALNKDERVTGVDVINKLFGRQRQRKGKIDTVDVLGLLVEVVADPLWLIAGPGLTKAGRAMKLSQAGLRGLKAGRYTVKEMRNIIQLAKSGKTIPKGPAKKMIRAFRTVYEAGRTPKMARTWAEQAAKGERALLKLGLPGKRVPVIKGKAFWKGAEKVSKYLKKGPLGKIFLPPTRKVSDRYSELHDIAVHYAGDLPVAEQGKLMDSLKRLSVDMGKIEDLAAADEKMAKFIEAHFAGPMVAKRITNIKAKRVARAAPKIAKATKEIEAVKKQAITQLKRFEEAKKVPFRPKPVAQKAKKFRPKTHRGLLRDVNRELRGHPLYVQELDNLADQYDTLLGHMGKVYFGKTDMADVLQYLDMKPDKRRTIWKYITGSRSEGINWDIKADELANMMGREPITDAYEFIQVLDDALKSNKTVHGLNALVLKRLDEIQEPSLQMLLSKRSNVLLGRSATQINADLIGMAKHYGGTTSDVDYLLVPQKGKALPKQRELTARWRWQAAMDKAHARARTQRIEGRLDVILKRKQTLEKRIGRWEKGAVREDIKSIQFAKERGVKLKTEAGEILETVPETGRGRFEEIAGKLHKVDEKRLLLEQAQKVPVTEIDEMLGYLRRLMTPEALAFKNELAMQEKFLSRAKMFSVRAPTQRRRSRLLGKLTRDEVQDVFKDLGFEGQVFEPSALASAMTRGREHARVMGSAKTIHEAVRKFSKTQQWADDMVRMGKPVEAMEDLQDFMQTTGLVVKPGEYAGRVIPKEIAVALREMNEVMSSSDVARGFWKGYTSVQRYLKGAFTMPFPAYHGRNAISNFFLNWIGGVKNPASYVNAAKLQKAAIAARRIMKARNISWDEASAMVDWPVIGNMAGKQFWDMANSWGVVGRSLGEMGMEEVAGAVTMGKRAQGVVRKHFAGQGPVWQGMRRFTGAIEDNARLAHFVDKISQGFDPQSAARSMKKVLFDYGDLSQWEKKWARDRIFFFYTFARKNLPLQIETTLTQPGKQAFFSHLAGGTPRMQEEARSYPDYWQEKLIIPLRDTDKEGTERVIAGAGLPIEEAFGPVAGPGVGPLNRIRRIASRGASRLSPMITTPAEFITQRQLYFDRPIRKWGQWGVQKSPVGRFYGTYKGLRYGKDVPGSKVSGTLTGVRYKPFNVAERTEYKAKQIARDYLAKQKEARTFKRYYVPAEQRQGLSPDIQQALKAQ